MPIVRAVEEHGLASGQSPEYPHQDMNARPLTRVIDFGLGPGSPPCMNSPAKVDFRARLRELCMQAGRYARTYARARVMYGWLIGQIRPSSDTKHAWEVIKSVASVPRVGITCKMLDRRDGSKLETLLLKLHPAKAPGAGNTVEEYAAVRKSLGI